MVSGPVHTDSLDPLHDQREASKFWNGYAWQQDELPAFLYDLQQQDLLLKFDRYNNGINILRQLGLIVELTASQGQNEFSVGIQSYAPSNVFTEFY